MALLSIDKNIYDIFTEPDRLYCKYCSTYLYKINSYSLNRHEQTDKHKHFYQVATSVSTTVNSAEVLMTRKSEFSRELCEAFLAADIPLWKLQNKKLHNFLEKWTHQNIPEASTIRKNYIKPCYIETMCKIRNSVGENDVWISDETTDVENRAVANFIIGTLHSDRPGKIYLLHSAVLEKTNNRTIVKFVLKSLEQLWPAGIKYEKVLLFVSDGAAYMKKAGEKLCATFHKMIHVTCVAHGLHRVAEEVRCIYKKTNWIISETKKIFRKAPYRIKLFKKILPTVPLPPSPITTRWGTWIEAACYYNEYFSAIKDVIVVLPNDSAAIKKAKRLFQSSKIQEELEIIHKNFQCLIIAIKKLENQNLLLIDAIKEIQNVQNIILASDDIKLCIKKKLISVLKKNIGYQKLTLDQKCICPIFNYAPLTSCDVERSFSTYKSILADNRRSFKFDNLKEVLIVNCFYN